jgi:hypothetical protein
MMVLCSSGATMTYRIPSMLHMVIRSPLNALSLSSNTSFGSPLVTKKCENVSHAIMLEFICQTKARQAKPVMLARRL